MHTTVDVWLAVRRLPILIGHRKRMNVPKNVIQRVSDPKNSVKENKTNIIQLK